MQIEHKSQPDQMATCSVIIPVYGNQHSLSELLQRLKALAFQLSRELEVVFVIDGSPDESHQLLTEKLSGQPFTSRLILHSRNFGSFAAIRTGLERSSGSLTAVMAADLQEPIELMIDFFTTLDHEKVDLVVGVRRNRADPPLSMLASRVFWALYRRFVQHEMPPGGIDVFACNEAFRSQLLAMQETNSSLVAQALWLGFRRKEIAYDRLPRDRAHGRSGWTLRKKLKYLSDSIFSFTDLPIKLLLAGGCIGVATSIALASLVVLARIAGTIDVPGYTATILTVAFFAALNLTGLGILGAYVWRAYENTKRRPEPIVMSEQTFEADAPEQA